jgi:hypothetical protein
MTVLERFLQFAERLPAERLSAVEAALAEIMASHSERYDFSAAELSVLDQRVAEEKPAFSDSRDIAKLFGKPFSA